MNNISIIITPPKKNFFDFLYDNYQDKEEKNILFQEYLLDSPKKKDKKISKKNNKYGNKNKQNNSVKISSSNFKSNIVNDKNNNQINNKDDKLIDFNKRLSLLCNKRKRKEIKDSSETSVSSISKFFFNKIH